MTYAGETKVPIERTIAQIEVQVKRFGGEQFGQFRSDEKIVVGFTKDSRMVRFQVKLEADDARRNRSVARALLLVLKAKLVAVDSNVSTFEDEFLGNIVLPNGELVSKHVRPALEKAYETGEAPPLLPDYS